MTHKSAGDDDLRVWFTNQFGEVVSGSEDDRRRVVEPQRSDVLRYGPLGPFVTPAGSAAIERQEREGQQSLLQSDTLPIEGSKPRRDYVREGGQFRSETLDEWMKHPDDPAWAALGFVFGEPVIEFDGDAIFRYVTLPDGWKRRATDHGMWTEIVDERGRKRVGIFYKAAFYDRSAHMFLTKMEGPTKGLVYDDHPFELVADATPDYQRCETCSRERTFRWHHLEFPFGDEVS